MSANSVGWGRVEIVDGTARSPELEIELAPTQAGALVPRPARAGETVTMTLGAAELRLMIGRPAADVGPGDVVVPLGRQGDIEVVGHTVACGVGAVALTDQRVIGLVWRSTVDAESLRASLSDEGHGSVLIFTVDRDQLTEAKVKQGFGGNVKAATLSGVCNLDLASIVLLDSSGAFAKPPPDVVPEALRRFVRG